MGELSGKTNKTVKQLFQVKLTFFATLPHASIPQAKKNHPAGVASSQTQKSPRSAGLVKEKPPRWAV